MKPRLVRNITLAGLYATCALGLALPALAQTADQATLQELRRTIEAQQRQIQQQAELLQQLQRRVEEVSRSTERAEQQAHKAAQQAAALGGAPPVVTSAEKNVNLAISGQVNRGVLLVEDGVRTEVFHVDNDNSSTRLRLVGTAQVSDDFGLGSNIEVQFESNSTASVSQSANRGVGPNSFTERKLEFYLDSKRLGRLWVGQGSTASDGTSELDLSGTGVVGYAGIADFAGGLLFRNSQTNQLTTASIGSVYSQLDGLSREDRVRYDTPRFGGFQLSASAIADDRWDGALRFGGDFGSVKAAAALGYANPSTASADQRINGSASFLHVSGFNLTIAGGEDDPETAGRSDPKFFYAKLGYIAHIFSIGSTAFAFDYSQTDDIAQNGDEFTTAGAFAVQSLDDYGTQFYLGIRHHDLDRPGTPDGRHPRRADRCPREVLTPA